MNIYLPSIIIPQTDDAMRPADPRKDISIRDAALAMIAAEGLENLSMQRLAKAAGVSPRTIYLKYEHKEDMLVRLFIDAVLPEYEAAVLQGFSDTMAFASGVAHLWRNAFRYLSTNEPQFRLLMYAKASPLLVAAFSQARIAEGSHFRPVAAFLTRHTRAGAIRKLPYAAARALLFAPLFDLVSEYYEYRSRPRQLVTPHLIDAAAEAAAAAFLL